MRRHLAIIPVALVAIGIAPGRADGDGLPVSGSTRARPASRPPAPPPVTSRFRRVATRWSPASAAPAARCCARACCAARYDPRGGARRVSERPLGRRRTLVLIRPRPAFPRARTRSRCSARAGSRCADRHPQRRLQLRRAVAGRRHALPGPVHVAPRPDPLSGPRLRPAPRSAAPRADRRPARAGRADARLPDHARDEPRRALGVHALRRRGRAPVHPRARHDRGRGRLHRPRRADRPAGPRRPHPGARRRRSSADRARLPGSRAGRRPSHVPRPQAGRGAAASRDRARSRRRRRCRGP